MCCNLTLKCRNSRLGAQYGPLISHTLKNSVQLTEVEAFMDTMNLKQPNIRQCRHSTTFRMVRKSSLNPNSNTMECDRRKHNSPASCVIAQQYSSTTFVSLGFHSHKEKFGVRLKM